MLIGVTGLAGAGKSTTISYIAKHVAGAEVYVGEYIKKEVSRRGLEQSPETERIIREDVRATEGDDAFARRALPEIESVLESGTAFIDAVYVQAEWELYCSVFPDKTTLLHIDTSQEQRIRRLAKRKCRPLTRQELIDRDEFELCTLHLDQVFAIADKRLPNETEVSDLYDRLRELITPSRA